MKKNAKLLLIFKICFLNVLIIPCFGETHQNEISIETYLNSIKTIEAKIIQISSNGEVQTGKLFLEKPGKMRFEYDPPGNHLVMVSGFLLVVIDKKSNSEPQRYLTSQTPIGFLLDENIKIRKNSNIKSLSSQGSNISISLHDIKNPSSGELELIFLKEPIALKEWTITNYSGEKTRVLLEQVIINKSINDNLFNIGGELAKLKKKLGN